MPITKEDIKELLIFTKGEKKGIIVLIILIIITVLINQFSYLFYEEDKTDFTQFKNEIAEFEKNLTPKNETFKKNTSNIDKKYDTLKLFKFNPNTSSEKEWKLLGLSEKQIKIIKNYLNKGGNFKYKTDLKKIYGLPEVQFQKLYPYINLPEKKKYAQNTGYETFDEKSKKKYDEKKSDNIIPDVEEYFKFNPNEISEVEWQKLGFSNKQIATILNYLSKGGKFYKKGDLKKIYGIKDFQYERIKNFIEIPENENNNYYKNEEVVVENQKVDINNLSVEDMKKLGKFWKYRATRIVKYRNWLGGFYKKEQLLEVYGMKMEDYLKVKDDIIIDKNKIEKIHLNFAEVSELARHPYISYEEAKKILDYRNKKGPFKEVSDLIKKKLISQELYNKTSPYLKVK